MNQTGMELIKKADGIRSRLDSNFRDVFVVDIYKNVESIYEKSVNITSQKNMM